jgi:hypothetical protein
MTARCHSSSARTVPWLCAAALRFPFAPAVAEPEEVGNGGRVQWVSGRRGATLACAGTDFIVVRDGRIGAVYLFFDKL